MTERDYILGTLDVEVERLALQHSVWRSRALDAWARAGFTAGQTILDVGSGSPRWPLSIWPRSSGRRAG